MRDQRIPDPAEEPLAQDALEHAALVIVLDRRHLHIDELARELGDPPDRVEVAVAALVGAGLLHRHDEFVLPTRAAVRFDELRSG
jgi:predicted transcriptional regulator